MAPSTVQNRMYRDRAKKKKKKSEAKLILAKLPLVFFFKYSMDPCLGASIALFWIAAICVAI